MSLARGVESCLMCYLAYKRLKKTKKQQRNEIVNRMATVPYSIVRLTVD